MKKIFRFSSRYEFFGAKWGLQIWIFLFFEILNDIRRCFFQVAVTGVTVPNPGGLDPPVWLLSQVVFFWGVQVFKLISLRKSIKYTFVKNFETQKCENKIAKMLHKPYNNRASIMARDRGPTRQPNGHRFFFWPCHTGFNFPRHARPPPSGYCHTCDSHLKKNTSLIIFC